MIKAIVLDFGGVLLRTEDRSSRRELEDKYNLPPGGTDTLVFNSPLAKASTIGKVESDQIWQNVAEKLSLSPRSLESFKNAFWAGDQLDQELLWFIQDCRPKYSTAILTNAWMDARDTLADEFCITEGQTVDHILISSELGVAKPDQAIYKILADTLGCAYTQILFVDDFLENIESAKALGVHTIHYQPGTNLINAIKLILNQ